MIWFFTGLCISLAVLILIKILVFPSVLDDYGFYHKNGEISRKWEISCNSDWFRDSKIYRKLYVFNRWLWGFEYQNRIKIIKLSDPQWISLKVAIEFVPLNKYSYAFVGLGDDQFIQFLDENDKEVNRTKY